MLRENPIEAIGQIGGSDIQVHQHRCALVRNRNAGCGRCADACTSGCISFADGRLVVNHDLCTGCGTCATVCPTCAIEACGPNNDQALFQRCSEALRAVGEDAVIACEPAAQAAEGSIDSARVATVRNLGRVDETLIVRLARAGATRILLVEAPGDDRAQAKGAETAREVCDNANALLAAWNIGARAHVVRDFPESVHARRWESGAGESSEPASPAAAGRPPAGAASSGAPLRSGGEGGARHLKVMAADRTLPHFVPDRHEQLLDLLCEVGGPADVTLRTRLWGRVGIDLSRCVGCRMCATFCPTGALLKFTCEDGGGVEHAPSDCVQCRTCESICPTRAISVHDDVSARDLALGEPQRIFMPPEDDMLTSPRSIERAMRRVLGIPQVRER